MSDFVKLYKEMIDYLRSNYPKYETVYQQYETDDEQFFVANYVQLVLPFIDEIISNNSDIFVYKHKRATLLNGLPFSKLFKSATDEVKAAIFKYLTDLYTVGYTMFPMYVKRFKDQHIVERTLAVENFANILRVINKEEVVVDEVELSESDDEEEGGGFAEMLESFKGSEMGKTIQSVLEESGLGDLENMASEDGDSIKNSVQSLLGVDISSEEFNPTNLLSNAGSMIEKIKSKVEQSIESVPEAERTPENLLNNLLGNNPLNSVFTNLMSTVQRKCENGEIDMQKMMQEMGQTIMKSQMSAPKKKNNK